MISIKSLRVDYEKVTAVNDLSVEIPAGQIYGLVGPNGAGKTSTLKSIAGIIEPTYGEIKLNGIALDLNPAQALKHLGFMPDFPPLYENLKVWEYLEVFAAAYFIERNQRLARAKEWVQRVNLMEKWDSYIRELSRGMRQRLVLAKTFLHGPEIVILDEPASGLDPIGRVEMRDILKEMAAKGKTIVISSHILSELSDYCDAAGIMEKGRLVVSGSIDSIRAKIGAKAELIIRLTESTGAVKEALFSALGNSPVIANTNETCQGEFHSVFSGEEKDASVLLAQLIERHLPIAQFFIKQADIQDIFLKIGAKEVS